MIPFRDSNLSKTIVALLFLVLAAYAYYETRGLLYGPRIHLATELVTSDDRFFLIEGTAERIATLSMNGAPISVTEDGSFQEPYLLAPGLNRVVFDAEDKYGNTRQEVLQIYFAGDAVSTSVPALPTSTEPFSTTTQGVASSTP